MSLDKITIAKLKKFADVFKGASERNSNESDTVMYLIKFFEEILGYDPLSGQIRKEVSIKERHCDFAIVLDPQAKDGKPEFLVEAKSAGIKILHEKHIEQAYNYAANQGVQWVVLTNGVEWHLYHLTFDNGIQPDLVFKLRYVEQLEMNAELVWDTLSILAKENAGDGSLKAYYERKKLLSPKNVVNVLISEPVLAKVRQELNRKAADRLAMNDIFYAVMHVLDQDAKDAAGGLGPPVKRKKHRRRGKAETQLPAEQPLPENTIPIPPQTDSTVEATG